MCGLGLVRQPRKVSTRPVAWRGAPLAGLACVGRVDHKKRSVIPYLPHLPSPILRQRIIQEIQEICSSQVPHVLKWLHELPLPEKISSAAAMHTAAACPSPIISMHRCRNLIIIGDVHLCTWRQVCRPPGACTPADAASSARLLCSLARQQPGLVVDDNASDTFLRDVAWQCLPARWRRSMQVWDRSTGVDQPPCVSARLPLLPVRIRYCILPASRDRTRSLCVPPSRESALCLDGTPL